MRGLQHTKMELRYDLKSKKMELKNIVRENIFSLAPYSTARDEYKGEIGVYLDANENPYENSGYNRYPDPHQYLLKERIAEIKGVDSKNLFLGNGSDEAIDLVYRIFCRPGVDEAVVITPSYGMYGVCANINDVKLKEVALNSDYTLDGDLILSEVTPQSKVIMLCSPNNPSGNSLERSEIVKIIENFEGVVVIDEAYIDFAEDEGYVPLLAKYDNIIVLQTLSKAWGMAGLRVGMAFASAEIIELMSRVKYPYNINCAAQQIVLDRLTPECVERVEAQRAEIVSERKMLSEELSKIGYITKVYPSDANFILVAAPEATKLYNKLIEEKIIVRDRSRVFLCGDALRITVGTPSENQKLLKILKSDETGSFYR